MKIQLETILKTVAEYYGLSLNLTKLKSRRADIVKVNHVYFYLASNFTNESLTKIGRLVNRDHATVIHGVNKIRIEINLYLKIKTEIEDLIPMIQPRNSLVIENIDLLQLTENYTRSFI